jgi:transcriptional regulator with XRE-family HTH domain
VGVTAVDQPGNVRRHLDTFEGLRKAGKLHHEHYFGSTDQHAIFGKTKLPEVAAAYVGMDDGRLQGWYKSKTSFPASSARSSILGRSAVLWKVDVDQLAMEGRVLPLVVTLCHGEVAWWGWLQARGRSATAGPRPLAELRRGRARAGQARTGAGDPDRPRRPDPRHAPPRLHQRHGLGRRRGPRAPAPRPARQHPGRTPADAMAKLEVLEELICQEEHVAHQLALLMSARADLAVIFAAAHVAERKHRITTMERPNRIRELRELRGLSQRDLARRLGLTGPEVHKLETGMRRLRSEHLDKLTAILGEDAGAIAGWTPSPPQSPSQMDRIEAKLDELLALMRTTGRRRSA